MANRPQYTTPPGVLVFPYLNEPDTHYADDRAPDGHYKANLRLSLDDPETQKFLGRLDDLWDQFYKEECAAKGKKVLKTDEDSRPYKKEIDQETGEATGYVIVRTKLKATVPMKGRDPFSQRPKIFDSQRVPIKMDDVPAIGGGTTARLAGSVYHWHTAKAGQSLWCEGVQLIEVVEKTGSERKADDFGFADAADGFAVESFPAGKEGGDF